MSGGFSADPAKLRQHGGEFTGHAQRASDIHRQLSKALTEAGECWGDDEAGRAFAAGHMQPAQDTLGRLGALPAGLADVGERFTGTADRYEQAEDENAANLRKQD
ncbi:MAG TPA: hypothetical protein VGM75_23225 [Pseudonocardiaceae bacterium]